MRSSRSRRFTSDDLPALGRPTIAIAVSCVSQVLGFSGSRRQVRRCWFASRLELLDDHFEQIAGAVAVLGADLDHGVEAESIQLERAGAGAAIVGLVDRENHRHAGVARGLGNVLVAGNQTLAAVDDHHDQIGGLQRAAALGHHELVQRILARAEQTAGVREIEVIALPRHGMRDDVAGRPGDRRDDRAAGPAQTIEQRRLTDVRSTDQHDLTKTSARHDRLYITGQRACAALWLTGNAQRCR